MNLASILSETKVVVDSLSNKSKFYLISNVLNLISVRKPLKTKPTVIICNTIKGKGISKIENSPEWHYKSKLTDKELEYLKKNL